MNQTKKRLSIIKLAISMTDTETIQLQVLKLGMMQVDEKMQEILTLLNEQSYARAQNLISDYIEAPSDTTVLQRTPQAKSQDPMHHTDQAPTQEELSPKVDIPPSYDEIQVSNDQATIDEFELFIKDADTNPDDNSKEELNYDDFLDTAPVAKKLSTEAVNYDMLLNVDANDVLADNISLDISQQEDNTSSQKEETLALKKTMPTRHYKPMPRIKQKFENMQNQYPSLDTSTHSFDSVDKLVFQISSSGYSEAEIEKTIEQIETLSDTNKAEASQLLLITAATESKYAQFRLARALYKGDIFEKNLSEALSIIKHLAVNDDYPEAICDLAQFYENGIGINKDKKEAQALYKKAMDLGIQRAAAHHERIAKQNKKFFSHL